MRILSKRFSPLYMERELGSFLEEQLSSLFPTICTDRSQGVDSSSSDENNNKSSSSGGGSGSSETLREEDLASKVLTDPQLADVCASIITSLEDPPTTYSEEAGEYWDALVAEMPLNWTAQVIHELQQLRLSDLRAAVQNWLLDSARRRSVSMMVFGPQHQDKLSALQQVQKGADSAGVLSSQAPHKPDYGDTEDYSHSARSSATTTTIAAAPTGSDTCCSNFFNSVYLVDSEPTAAVEGRSKGCSSADYHFGLDALTVLRNSIPLYGVSCSSRRSDSEREE